jgi:hypothetical protein
MCFFCGGQCGGLGDLLIALGLPSLALYFFKLKEKLAQVKNRLAGNDNDASQPGPG